MATRTMAHIRRAETPHIGWCARDHRCIGDVHQSASLIADAIGGRAVITRVRAGDVEYAEVRARIPLHSNEKAARWQLGTVLGLMRELLAAVAVRPGVLHSRADRPALSRRANDR